MAAKCELWSVPDLKVELGRRCARTSGRKTDLIERLKSYDRNQNFKGPKIILPQPLDAGWPSSGFQQLIPQHKILLPLITRSQLDGYFIYRMADDRHATNDIEAMEKRQRMFAANRILACSIHVTQSVIFFSGIVGASMKTRVSYNYKLKIDKKGEPVNSHCECPAGKGPQGTCKHIAAVLLMLEHFVSTGDVMIEKSCTENLQTFQQPKSYYNGSPVKAADIPTKRKLSSTLFEDPRPAKFQNMKGYKYHV